MFNIIRAYRQQLPALRFIGKAYGTPGHWDEWFANGWFDALEAAMGGTKTVQALWPDGGGYVSMTARVAQGKTVYWLGMFTPPDTPVPAGFQALDLAAAAIGVCWLQGAENDLFGQHTACLAALAAAGIAVPTDVRDIRYSFENCLCPRFTTPDENGDVILDQCYYLP